MKIKKIISIIMLIVMLTSFLPHDVIATDIEIEDEVNDENTEELNEIDAHNEAVLAKVQRLQELAEEYIITNRIEDTTATELCLQYIRKDRYNSSTWQMLLGSVDSNFVSYVEVQENYPVFKDSNGKWDILKDPSTGKPIDFVHLVAPLNAYIKHGETVKQEIFGQVIDTGISTHYAGWAGDLMSLLEQITLYRVNNLGNGDRGYDIVEQSEEFQEFNLYCSSLLGTNNIDSKCSSSDMLADLDALVLYKEKETELKEDLYDALYNYYIGSEMSLERLEKAYNYITSYCGDEYGWLDVENAFLSNNVIREKLFDGTTDGLGNEISGQIISSWVTDDDLQVVRSYI